jgi:hypothetical protein
MTPPFATHICVAKSPYIRWWGLYQRIYYALPEMALQGFAATLIYALVTPSNNRCKFATNIIGIWQHLYVFVQIMDEGLL